LKLTKHLPLKAEYPGLYCKASSLAYSREDVILLYRMSPSLKQLRGKDGWNVHLEDVWFIGSGKSGTEAGAKYTLLNANLDSGTVRLRDQMDQTVEIHPNTDAFLRMENINRGPRGGVERQGG